MKSNLNKSTGSSYQLIFTKLPFRTEIIDSEILSLNIHSTVLPSMSLSSVELEWMGAKYEMAIAPMIFEPWFIQFIVDSDYKNWYLLHQWMTLIGNNKDHYDKAPRDYWVDGSLTIVDNFNQKVMDIDIIDRYPTMLGECSLSHREGETNMESSVNFNYVRYEVDYIKNG
jgi:hypothetical protein